MSNSVMWFRRDLRLSDNPALVAASKATGGVTPLFVLDPLFLKRSGAPRLAFLFRSLRALNHEMSGALVVRIGNPVDIVAQVAKEVGATQVYSAQDFGPYGQKRDAAVAASLLAIGADLYQVGSPYAVDPGTVRKTDGTPYAVFAPFSKIWLAQGSTKPTGKVNVTWCGGPYVRSDEIPQDPMPRIQIPDASEAAAWARWEYFSKTGLDTYTSERNNPDRDRCSKMSVYLRFGTVHPRQLLAKLPLHADQYRRELCWREFYGDLLFHHPESVWQNFQPNMNSLKVDTDAQALQRFARWCAGATGYPIVDAGIRQMLATGWMHNRVRMITASFLVKDLHLPWQWGAKFFMKHLVDGDIASNNQGWQWVAGTGADAAPYFRIFNPVLQGKTFDPDGNFVREWVPEIRQLPTKFVHSPWLADIESFGGYVSPIVEHAHERGESLRRYDLSRNKQAVIP